MAGNSHLHLANKNPNYQNSSAPKVLPIDINNQRFLGQIKTQPNTSKAQKNHTPVTGQDDSRGFRQGAFTFGASTTTQMTVSPVNVNGISSVHSPAHAQRSNPSSVYKQAERRSGSQHSKGRSYSQNNTNRKVISNFLNTANPTVSSPQMANQNRANQGGRSVQHQQSPQLLYNNFGEGQMPSSNSALVEKYSSLINKGIAPGAKGGQQ